MGAFTGAGWSLDPSVVVGLAGVTLLYVRGHRRRMSDGRWRRAIAFAVAVAVVVVALLSPVAVVSGRLLWVHMVQHLLLTVVAAPLLAVAGPVTTIRAGLSPAARGWLARLARWSRRSRRRVGDPPPLPVATAVHVALLWAWHLPALYDLAVTVTVIHALEHVSFVASAVWMWAEVVATARRGRRDQALATMCLGGLIAQGGVLGALLTFAGRSLYVSYSGDAGLTALEDQQLAGALMWVPPGFVYAVVAVRRFAAWLNAAERELAAREARERVSGPRSAAGRD